MLEKLLELLHYYHRGNFIRWHPLYSMLTDNRGAFLIDDSTWQQMEVKLLALNNYCVASIIASLKKKTFVLIS